LLARTVTVRPCVVPVAAGVFQLVFQAANALVSHVEPALGNLQRGVGVGQPPIGVAEPPPHLVELAQQRSSRPIVHRPPPGAVDRTERQATGYASVVTDHRRTRERPPRPSLQAVPPLATGGHIAAAALDGAPGIPLSSV
jgi:hypothetical protein